jgi:hypothetical protein
MSRCIRLEIPLGTKRWINENQRLFWRVKSLRIKAWREDTRRIATEAKAPHLLRAYIIGELHFGTNARRDPANWAPTAKACVDGLVDAGVFDDDNYRHVTGPDMRIGEKVPNEARNLTLLIFPNEM